MFYLLLAIICSSLISIVMRLGTSLVKYKLSMLAANYAACFVLAATLTGSGSFLPAVPELPRTLALGAFNGLVYLSAFVLMQRSVRTSGVVLSTTFSKLGLLVPIVVSVLLFGELPTALQALGFVLSLVAIVLINPKNSEEKGKGLSLIILLLVCGSADAMNKVYNELGSAALSSQFLLYTFLSALILCLLLVLRGHEKPGKSEILFGIILGIPNYFSARFALMALGTLPAVIVYPTMSVATILLVSLTGVLAFREKLSGRQWLAMGFILVSVALLNI